MKTAPGSQVKSARRSRLTPGRVSSSASALDDLILVEDLAEEAAFLCGRGRALDAFEALENLINWTRERLSQESDEIALIRNEAPEWLINKRLHEKRKDLIPKWLPSGYFRDDGTYILPAQDDPNEPEITVWPNDSFKSHVSPVAGSGLVQLYAWALGVGTAAAIVHLSDTVGLSRQVADG